MADDKVILGLNERTRRRRLTIDRMVGMRAVISWPREPQKLDITLFVLLSYNYSSTNLLFYCFCQSVMYISYTWLLKILF